MPFKVGKVEDLVLKLITPLLIDANTEENPLIEQMQIVRNYIDQARKAHRFEEVASLEENLRMLKETYRQQQRTS